MRQVREAQGCNRLESAFQLNRMCFMRRTQAAGRCVWKVGRMDSGRGQMGAGSSCSKVCSVQSSVCDGSALRGPEEEDIRRKESQVKKGLIKLC